MKDNPAIDVVSAEKQQKISPGCIPGHGYQQQEATAVDPCNENQCNKGKCVPVNDHDYECKCRSGWSGKYCDQGDLELSLDKQS